MSEKLLLADGGLEGHILITVVKKSGLVKLSTQVN